MGRYAVFVDGGYLDRLVAEMGNVKVCFRKLSDHFAGSDERLRTYYYHCAPFQSKSPAEREQQPKSGFDRFVAAIEGSVPRLQVRLGRLAFRQEPEGTARYEQKQVEVLLAVDLVRLSCERQIQRAVIVAGDSDFVPAIQVARDAGTIVQVCYGVNPRPHDELLRASDDRILIDQEFLNAVRR
jgi:uncharacterized LabA/DUF88 family protein